MGETLQSKYFGKGGPLFWLYVRTAALTILTLGIYRFWAKTRLRRYIWSSVVVDGDSFEYTGTGLEKLLGFLVAIVFLAVYLALVQLLLFFVGLNLFIEPATQAQALSQVSAIYLAFLSVLPLLLFAVYRARRYKMARTRFRGIRFGMERGAWGYVWRALLHFALTAVSLGALLPRQTFWLEKYTTDRSWYGDGRFVQHGKWTDLYAGMKHLFIGLGFAIAGAVLLATVSSGAVPGFVSLIGGFVWMMVGFVSYRVYAFNYLTLHKVLDGHVTFRADVDTSRVIGILIIGTLGIGVAFAIASGIIGVIAAGVSGAVIGDQITTGVSVTVGVIGAVVYVSLILLAAALNLVMMTQPVIAHAVGTMIAGHTEHLDTLRQRTADDGADAEGFADALDIGGAI